MNYLLVNVIGPKFGPDCSNNGVTANPNNKFYVPCEDGNFTEKDLVGNENNILLELNENPIRESFKVKGETRWVMRGGNFVYSSDSRFGRKYGGPVAVHDRIEN